MAVNGRTHEQIAPLFNLKLGQPFLSRPLHDIEVRLVNEWVDFFNDPPNRLYGVRASEFDNPFRSHLTSKGYNHRTIRPSNGKNQQAFQDLFIAKNKVDIVTAVKRICGNEIVLTPVEKRLAFREVVAHYRNLDIDTARPIPSLDDFDLYNKSRLFLPNTGVICPTRSVFCRPIRPFSTKVLFVYYTQFMNIPSEINAEELGTILPKKFDVIKKAYQSIVDYRQEMLIDSNIAMPDVELTGPDTIDNLEEMAFKASKFFEAVFSLDAEQNGIFQEFQKRYGQIDQEVSKEQQTKPLEIDTKIRRRAKMPLSFETQNIFIQTWQFLNPSGYKPSMRILADPPTAKKLKEIRDLQFKLVREHGQLPNHICRELKIPNFFIPTTTEIENYRGNCGGTGYPALLRDIENRVWPASETSLAEIFDNQKGIVFNNKIQLSQLKRNFKKQTTPNVNHMPRAVIRELKDYLEVDLQAKMYLFDSEQAGEISESPIEQDILRKRIENLEDIVVSKWYDFEKTTIRRQGNGFTQDQLIDKFQRHIIKILDPGCYEEGLNQEMRLFQGLDSNGSQLSFAQGLKRRIQSLNPLEAVRTSSSENQTTISK